jgi:hypothetical protein
VPTTPLESPRYHESDQDFLTSVALRILGTNSAAATTAARLIALGIDARRIDSLIPAQRGAIEIGRFLVKKVESDTEFHGKFGLFVRVKGASDQAALTQSSPRSAQAAPQG